MRKLERYIKKEFIRKLKPTYLKLVDKKRKRVHIGDSFCYLQTWYAGFWSDSDDDINNREGIDNALNKLVDIANRECPLKKIALQNIEVSFSKHWFNGLYVNIGITFGGE